MPIELLDVAGLVPGAHEGKGLGNKFLDDLRHADALIHVVDVSGTTDAEGEIKSTLCRSIFHAERLLGQGRQPGAMIPPKTSYG